jgi:hypothetical protein
LQLDWRLIYSRGSSLPNQLYWTREELERINDREVNLLQLAKEFEVSRETLYNVRRRIQNIGIDGIVEAQTTRAKRNSYRKGNLLTRLGRIYQMQVNTSRRDSRQYSVTIPRELGDLFVKQWGTHIRFVPQEEGILIVPSQTQNLDGLPAWAQKD